MLTVDLGAPAVVGIELRDSTGTLANATAMTCTVTLPDGTTTAATVTNPSTGVYVATLSATTQIGDHVAYFVATGMDTEDRRGCERELLTTYADRLASHGVEVMNADERWFAYRVLLVTGFVAAAVTAVFKDRLQQAANAEAGLARACTAVADLESFAALRDQMARVG